MSAFFKTLVECWREGHGVALSIFRFLVPILIAVKLLEESGLIPYLAMPMRPLMDMLGLPAELSLAWLPCMFVSLYSGLAVLISLVPQLPELTVAQMTVFGLMVLIAHGLIIEVRIAGQCGVAMPFQFVLRLVSAIVAGLLLHLVLDGFGLLQSKAVILLAAEPTTSWADWFLEFMQSIAEIYVIVCALMLLQRFLDAFRVSEYMGQALGPVVSSFSRVKVETDNVGIATNMAAGMCAEFAQRSAELDRVRALHDNRTTDAQDDIIREKYGHRLAAQRMIKGYEAAVKTFGDFSESCRKFDSKTDELLSLLGLASGALALLHDFNSEKSVGISLDVPGIIEKSAACFSDDDWWGMPTALRASIWLSIPGAGPEGVDPIEAMKEAANKGDAQGVLLARAMLVMMANTVGRPDAACEALANIPPQNSLNHDYDMLNAYAMGLMTHQADLAWAHKFGYRAPFMKPSCPAEQPGASLSDQDVDDLLDGLLDEEDDAPAAAPQTPAQ